MKRALVVGERSVVSFVVNENMAAAFEGKPVHNVLSTFHLVYYSELAARRLIEPYLESGEEAAGTGICLKHIAPTKIGDSVELAAVLTKIDGRELTCEISAVNSSGTICIGTQTQVLIEKGKLDRK